MKMKGIVTIILALFIIIPSSSSAILKENNNINEMENHNCLVYGIGYFPDFTYLSDAIFMFIISLLERVMRMTDVAFVSFLLIYILLINNIPGVKIPHTRYVVSLSGIGYVGTNGKDGSWKVASENFTDRFDLMILNFTGIWMQLPVIVKPLEYPICLDVFAGYGDYVKVAPPDY